MDTHVETGMFVACGFGIPHRNEQGNRGHQEGVVVPGFGELAVKKRVDHPLATAAWTVPARQHLEGAFERPGGLPGIDKVIYRTYRDNSYYRPYQKRAVHHMNIRK